MKLMTALSVMLFLFSAVTISAFEEHELFSEKTKNGTACQSVQSGTVILEESFEGQFPPAGWKILSFGSADQEWGQTDYTAHSGQKSAFIQFIQDPGTTDEWLVTKAIDLSTYRGARLLFWEEEIYWDYGKEHCV